MIETESTDLWSKEAKAATEDRDRYKNPADRCLAELQAYDGKYGNMVKDKDTSYDTLVNNLTAARRENKAVTDHLLQYDPHTHCLNASDPQTQSKSHHSS